MKYNSPRFFSKFHSPVKVFSDPLLEQQFEQDGITTFPFLNEREVEEISSFYHSLPQENVKGFHATLFRQDYLYRKNIDNKLKELLTDKLKQLFPAFLPLFGSFMVKEPGLDSEMKIHQDWSYVNEEKTLSFAVWFPLTDVDEENGVVQFMKGSHRYSLSVRGPGILCPFEKETNWIAGNALTNFPLKAGDAMAWNHRLVHGSLPNRSLLPRIAVTMIMVPIATEIFHFFHNTSSPESEVDMYQTDVEFFLKYEIGKQPEERSYISTFSYPLESLTVEALKLFSEKGKIRSNKFEILTRLSNLFKISAK